MADDLFRIGTDLVTDFPLLKDILPNYKKPVAPDWTFQPFSAAIKLGNGKLKGQGFGIVKWRWNIAHDTWREALRDYCPSPALSSEVYIFTPVNETASGVKTWKAFQCVMNWTPEDETKGGGKTLGLLIVFTHLVEVAYP